MHIVVLAHGPNQLTKRAVNRARKLAGSSKKVIAVAAAPVGQEAIASIAGAGTVASTGRAGLSEALVRLGDEAALLIHDDIVITTKGIVALERELAAGSKYALPYTNDRETDHFVGSLPADKAAERTLDQLNIPPTSKHATKVRPSCIAAAATDLADLLTESLADPYATISSDHYGFQIAGGALASHSTQCVHQLAQDDYSAERPLLVAAIIVKDEEDMLPDCLASLELICDRIEVCDTGSTDDTIAVARKAGASVIQREWTDDFGAARNEVLDRCRDAEYVLWIDADERLICADPQHTRRYLATYADEHAGFSLEITNLEADGSELYRFETVRLFHGSDTEFHGALHEAVHRTGDSLPLRGQRLDQLRIDHHGYAKAVVHKRSKARRNLDIAEAQHKNDGDARSAIHLARSLGYADETPERALELLEQSLAESGDSPAPTRAQILGLMGDCCLKLDQTQRAFDLAKQALELLPVDDTAVGILSAATDRLGNHSEFLAVAEMIDRAPAAAQVIRVDHNRLVYRDKLVAAYAHTDQLEKAVAAAFDLLSESPEALKSWPVLVDCLNRNYGPASIELLVPLAAMDPSGSFLEPMIRNYPSAALADFCAAYLSQGGMVTETIRVGLLAAAMADNDGAFALLVPAASDLDPFVRVGLADRVAAGGRADLAEQLRAEPVVLRL